MASVQRGLCVVCAGAGCAYACRDRGGGGGGAGGGGGEWGCGGGGVLPPCLAHVPAKVGCYSNFSKSSSSAIGVYRGRVAPRGEIRREEGGRRLPAR
jgi:hypothetical protein